MHQTYQTYRTSPVDQRLVDCTKACHDCETCNKNSFYQKLCVKDCNACTACIAAAAPVAAPEAILSRNYSPMNECVSTCGLQTCYDYHKQMQKYKECLRGGSSSNHCNKQYGCRVYSGLRFRASPPIHPKDTGCVKCWETGFTVL